MSLTFLGHPLFGEVARQGDWGAQSRAERDWDAQCSGMVAWGCLAVGSQHQVSPECPLCCIMCSRPLVSQLWESPCIL